MASALGGISQPGSTMNTLRDSATASLPTDESHLDRQVLVGIDARRLEIEPEQRTFGPGHARRVRAGCVTPSVSGRCNRATASAARSRRCVDMAALSEPVKAKGREPVAHREDGPDRPAVGEADHAPVRVASGYARDGVADAGRHRGVGLGAGDHVPSLLLEHLQDDRITFRHALAVDAAVPLAEVHLGQAGLDRRHEAEPRDKWSCCLGSPAQSW